MAGKKASYGVELDNKFSRPATGVVRSTEELRRGALKAGSAFKVMARDMAMATREARKSNTAMKRFGKGPAAATSGFVKNRGALTDWRTQAVFAKKRAQSLSETMKRLSAMAGRTGPAAQGAAGGFVSMAKSMAVGVVAGGLLTMALGAIANAFMLPIRGAYAFGRALVSTIVSLERSRMAVGMLATGGKQALTASIEMAKKYGLSIEDTTVQFRKLLAMQFKIGKAKDIIKMAADLRALGADAAEVQGIIRAVTQIKGKGVLQLEELQQQLGEKISVELVIGQLSKELGKSALEVRKLISAGKITADQGIEAVKAAVKQKLGIEKLGDAATKAGGTLGGMWDRLKASAEGVLFTLAGRLLPVLQKRIGPLIEKMIGAFDSPAGKLAIDELGKGLGRLVRMVGAIGKVMLASIGGFVRGLQKGMGATEGLVTATGELSPAQIAEMAGKMGELAVKIGAAVGKVLKLVDALNRLSTTGGVPGGPGGTGGMRIPAFGMDPNLLGSMKGGGFSGGLAVTQGMTAGINTGAPSVIAAATSLAARVTAATQSALGIHSRSKVFFGMGLRVPEGFTKGIESGTEGPQGAMNAMAAPPPTAGALAGAGGTNVGGISIAIDTGGAYGAAQTTDDPVAYAAAVQNMVRDQLAEELRDVLAQLGLA